MPRSRRAALALAVLWLTTASPAAGQQPTEQPPAPTTPGAPAGPTPPGAPAPTEPERPAERPAPLLAPTPEEPIPTGPGVAAPPTFRGPDLFNPPAHRGWLTLTPSIAIVGEYNDNLDLTTEDEVDDFILGLAPGLTLSIQRPEYRVLGGYNFTAELHAEETERNAAFKRHQLFLDAFYQFSPRLTFRLLERFFFDRETNVVTATGISAGRRDAYRNTVAPSLEWQATPLTSLVLSGSHTLLRFQGDEPDALDSDTYRLGLGLNRQFTPRLSGLLDLGVAYLDFKNVPDVTTYTPMAGLRYQFTRTLTGSVAAGPTFIDPEEGDSEVTPAIRVGLDRTFRAGSLTLGYDRAVTAESVGVTDRQTIFVSLRLLTLYRGLELSLTPQYTIADEDLEDSARDRKTEVLTVSVGASYQVARSISLLASYVFYRQEQDGRRGTIDQNRVFFGLQYGYPINFE